MSYLLLKLDFISAFLSLFLSLSISDNKPYNYILYSLSSLKRILRVCRRWWPLARHIIYVTYEKQISRGRVRFMRACKISARARAPKKLFSSLLVTFRLIRSLLDYQVGQIYGRKWRAPGMQGQRSRGGIAKWDFLLSDAAHPSSVREIVDKRR